ncbi:ubiquitin-conjugating enzyme E2 R1 isoform X1 [Lutra lutra]|uniref:ubiquitin-conjugating enzyme E2 R1 isoform X1 n=1 Tax=Lutra lutra TaxID=9657 RepID=UPI001FD2380B|nr:ubiquitin-conjugating enzyme E2 R1 isoform X1 [Lutra lutra]
MARPLVPSSQKALLLELKGLQEEPVEGFRVTLVDEGDLYNWEVAIFGPPNTYYEGGYFKARLKFPIDYPYSPPAFRFLTKMWHPNIYETGDVCISILHPPVDDPQSGELPSERWNPTQNVRTILLSVISLLNEPNTFSPANVDASVMYRKWKESKGKDREYTDIIRKRSKVCAKLRYDPGRGLSVYCRGAGAASPAAPTGTFWPQSWHVPTGSSLGRGHAWLSWKQYLGGTAGPPGLRGRCHGTSVCQNSPLCP